MAGLPGHSWSAVAGPADSYPLQNRQGGCDQEHGHAEWVRARTPASSAEDLQEESAP